MFGIKLLLVFGIMICLIGSASATDSGALSPGTMADDATVGTVAWTNPNNAKVSDNVYAVAASHITPTTHYLKATNFGFTIPVGATINGILAEFERKGSSASGSYNADSAIKIVKSDGIIGTTNKSTGATWSETESYISFGGTTDLWGETWTYTDINDADFGVVISAILDVNDKYPPTSVASVDHIRITVYYTEATPSQSKHFKFNGINNHLKLKKNGWWIFRW